MQSLVRESEELIARTTPIAPSRQIPAPKTSVGRNVASVIQSKEAVALSSSDRFSPSITAGSNILTQPCLLRLLLAERKSVNWSLNLQHQKHTNRTFRRYGSNANRT